MLFFPMICSFRLQLSRPAPDLTRPDWPGPLVQPRGAALSMALQWHSGTAWHSPPSSGSQRWQWRDPAKFPKDPQRKGGSQMGPGWVPGPTLWIGSLNTTGQSVSKEDVCASITPKKCKNALQIHFCTVTGLRWQAEICLDKIRRRRW